MPLQVSIFRGDSTNEKIRGKTHEDVSHSKQHTSSREISYNKNPPKYVIEENTGISLQDAHQKKSKWKLGVQEQLALQLQVDMNLFTYDI